ncbi:helix-turn-helix domain-containing protein [Streptomyces sp. URMC 129]|uniref:helix-turn-helix domain-containing protein n=1 Tax=Streptomyces sp. URMC 129 TaxID=3423407 RepID=UPI003F1CEC0C
MNKAQLGPALRALRMASGKEAKAVARSAVMSASKLSKLETGRTAPSVTDVERILTAIGVSEEIKAQYMAAARAEATEATAWRSYRRLGYHRKQQQIQALEAQTTNLRLFQHSLVPGLLQTHDYIHAVFARKRLGHEELAKTVQARLARQAVLLDAAKSFSFIITESVLRWRIVPSTLMAQQMDALITVSRRPNVDVRVMPLTAPQTEFPGHSFSIKDDRMVNVEAIHAELVVTDPRDIELYVRKFENFAATALAGDEMRAMVASIRDGFLREQESG